MSSTTEVREYSSQEGTKSGTGRSNITIRCPFCQALSTAYLWSLAGSGKRCENRACRAKFDRLGTATRSEVSR